MSLGSCLSLHVSHTQRDPPASPSYCLYPCGLPFSTCLLFQTSSFAACLPTSLLSPICFYVSPNLLSSLNPPLAFKQAQNATIFRCPLFNYSPISFLSFQLLSFPSTEGHADLHPNFKTAPPFLSLERKKSHYSSSG